MSDAKLEKLYTMVLENQELSITSLVQNEFTFEDITFLVKEGYLDLKIVNEEAIEKTAWNNKIRFIGVNPLFEYGRKCLRRGRSDIGFAAFRKCEELDVTFTRTIYRRLCNSLDNHDYELALFQISEIGKKSSEDANILLLLLGYLVPLSKQYKNKVQKLVENGSDDKESVYGLVVRGQFLKAKYCQNELISSKQNALNPERNMLVKTLITKCIDKQIQIKTSAEYYVRSEDIDGLFHYLGNLSSTTYLSSLEMQMYSLVRDIFQMQSTGIPVLARPNEKTFYSAVLAHDYDSALRSFSDYVDNHGESSTSISLGFLLKKAKDTRAELVTVPEVVDVPVVSNVEITMGNVPVVINSYGIDALEDILCGIVNLGYSIDFVQSMYSLSDGQISLVQLVMAKFFLQCGMKNEAMILIHHVDVKEFKSKTVKKLLLETNEMLQSEISLVAMSPFMRKLKRVSIDSLIKGGK